MNIVCLNHVIESSVVNTNGTSNDGVCRNGKLLALSVFAKNAFLGVSLNLSRSKDLNAFLLELAKLRVLIDDADFSTSLLVRLNNGYFAAFVHCRCNFDASKTAADNSHALLNEQVSTQAPLHKSKWCTKNTHAEARETPHEAHTWSVLTFNKLFQSVRVDNVLVVLTWNVWRNSLRTNSQDYLVSTKVLDELRSCLSVTTNINAKAFDFVIVPINQWRKFIVENLSKV